MLVLRSAGTFIISKRQWGQHRYLRLLLMSAPSMARTGRATNVRMYVPSSKPAMRLYSRGVNKEEEVVARGLLSTSINN